MVVVHAKNQRLKLLREQNLFNFILRLLKLQKKIEI
jgi:hypothetical protein